MEIAQLNDLKPRYTTSAGRIFTRDTEVVERVEALIGAHRRLLDSSYLGAFLADTFIDYPKLERLSLTLSVSDEYNDYGGPYKSAHVWSNEFGWTIKEEATRFSRLETETVNVPISTGADAVWKKINNSHIEIDGWEAFGAFFPERKAEIEARRLQARL